MEKLKCPLAVLSNFEFEGRNYTDNLLSFLEASAQEKTMGVIWAYVELPRMESEVILLE